MFTALFDVLRVNPWQHDEPGSFRKSQLQERAIAVCEMLIIPKPLAKKYTEVHNQPWMRPPYTRGVQCLEQVQLGSSGHIRWAG
ncbi:MAG: hypothetical protein L0Y44_13015 [Phycisphaerales bacterium]|nr:hypothetical protein [Phycisphaerales bacterium]MCI0631564.1 hypothetical protein [Phycisphaerales bacterium]MCI0675196.1 hypothetical protein [Phycisphaerales bacterium]